MFLFFFSNCEQAVEEAEFIEDLLLCFPIAFFGQDFLLSDCADWMRRVFQKLFFGVFFAGWVDGNSEDIFHLAKDGVRTAIGESILRKTVNVHAIVLDNLC